MTTKKPPYTNEFKNRNITELSNQNHTTTKTQAKHEGADRQTEIRATCPFTRDKPELGSPLLTMKETTPGTALSNYSRPNLHPKRESELCWNELIKTLISEKGGKLGVYMFKI